jgi:hypothetical protein
VVFIFISLALDDIISARVRLLFQAFLPTCVLFPAPDAERTWHETKRPALLCPQNLPCVRDGVSPESCVSLESFLRPPLVTCTSSGVRPNLVSDILRHIFIHTMLIPVSILVQGYPANHFEALICNDQSL